MRLGLRACPWKWLDQLLSIDRLFRPNDNPEDHDLTRAPIHLSDVDHNGRLHVIGSPHPIRFPITGCPNAPYRRMAGSTGYTDAGTT